MLKVYSFSVKSNDLDSNMMVQKIKRKCEAEGISFSHVMLSLIKKHCADLSIQHAENTKVESYTKRKI